MKQRKVILAQSSLKKDKAMAQEAIDLVHAFCEEDEHSRQLPRKKGLFKHTERCSETKVVSSVESLPLMVCHCRFIRNTINAITKNLFLAKCQANFLRAKKESLKANEVIIIRDFAENYQFLVQDEIQSYHWSKEYCTLHQLIVYLLMIMEIFNTVLLVLSLMITAIIQIFFIKYKQSF